MQDKKVQRFTMAQNFKICQAITEHQELYRSMSAKDAAKHLSAQVGFEVDHQKLGYTARELGIDLSKYERRQKKDRPSDQQALFNLAVLDVLRSLANVAVLHPDRLAAMQRQIEDLEEMA